MRQHRLKCVKAALKGLSVSRSLDVTGLELKKPSFQPTFCQPGSPERGRLKRRGRALEKGDAYQAA